MRKGRKEGGERTLTRRQRSRKNSRGKRRKEGGNRDIPG